MLADAFGLFNPSKKEKRKGFSSIALIALNPEKIKTQSLAARNEVYGGPRVKFPYLT